MQPVPGTLSLPGPSTLTYEYLLDLVASLTYNAPSSAPVVPKAIATIVAKVAQLPWWPMISPDEIVRKYIDDVQTPGDWETLGVVPTEIEQNAITYVRRYRNGANFSRPVVFPGRPQVRRPLPRGTDSDSRIFIPAGRVREILIDVTMSRI